MFHFRPLSMMARCVRKYGKEKTHTEPFTATLRMLVCYMVCSGAANVCVLSSAPGVVPSSSHDIPICAAFFLWSLAFIARNDACELPSVATVTLSGASTRVLHRFTLIVCLSLMLRSQDAPRDVPTYFPLLFIPLHLASCPSLQAFISVCAFSRARDLNALCRLICCIQLRVRTSTTAVVSTSLVV